MRFSSSFTILMGLAVSVVVAEESAIDTLTNSLINGLNAANSTAIASLAASHAPMLVPYLMSPGNKTIFTPTDAAVAKAKAQFSTLSDTEVEAILTYHIMNGTISYKKLPDAFDYHVVSSTLLNSSIYTNLPKGKSQVVVLQKSDTKIPIDITFGLEESHFNSAFDGPSMGNIQIQSIDTVMMPPVNFSATAANDEELKAMDIVLGQLKLSTAVDDIKGITMFAPTNEALSKVQKQLTGAPQNDTINVFLNHMINGTVLYSPQMPTSEAENDASSSKTTKLTTAGGVAISLSYGKDGKISVTSGNVTAKVVKTDVLLANGVVHYIDTVLANPLRNNSAARKAAGNEQATSPLSISVTNPGHVDGALLVHSNILLLAVVTVALSYLLI